MIFKGTPPANPKLPVGGSSECSALHSEAAFDEQVLVKAGRLQNVFVYVKSGLESYTFDWPKTPVTLSNQKCIYVPRVVGAQVHQPIRFANEDPTLHNIHAFLEGSEFNFSLFNKGTSSERKIRSPQIMARVKCDIHPWMIGFVGVVPHPFFAVTGENGEFELRGLPPGDFTIEAWHEKYGTQTRNAKLDAKGTAEVEFSFGS
ncbi:MAG TPA: carboxypeptidase regulatory-like domain-containing protein [Planctomycetota bacterium]|nr:carboxypeptidase regulatory-like domain-containing protein [Planctomycetota bacterium]